MTLGEARKLAIVHNHSCAARSAVRTDPEATNSHTDGTGRKSSACHEEVFAGGKPGELGDLSDAAAVIRFETALKASHGP